MVSKQQPFPKTYDHSGTVWTMAALRDDDFSTQALKKQQRREYRRYLREMHTLAELSHFSFTPFDYTPQLIPTQYVSPPPPDNSYLIADARKLAAGTYTPRIVSLVLATILGVWLDVVISGQAAGALSACLIIVAGWMAYGQLEEHQKAMERATANAQEKIFLLAQKFQEYVQQEQQRFHQLENLRVEGIHQLLQGIPSAIQDVCQLAILSINTPFLFRGRLELYHQELLFYFDLPDPDFIPPLEWEETGTGDYRTSERPPISSNRLYVEAMAAVLVQIALHIMEKAPTITTCYLNAYSWTEGRQFCRLATKITPEDIPAILASQCGLKIAESLGNIRVQLGYTLTPVDTLLPEWTETVVSRDVFRTTVHTTSPY
jgi:hypothetical protein